MASVVTTEYTVTAARAPPKVRGYAEAEHRTARHIMAQMFKQIAAWKKLNTEPEAMAHFKRLNNMP